MDQIDGLEECVTAFETQIHESKQTGTQLMSTPADVVTKAELDAAVTKASTAATARISAILTSPEAVGREKTAQHLAFASGMSAVDAVAMLSTIDIASKAAAPVAAAAPVVVSANTAFEAAMASGNPEVVATLNAADAPKPKRFASAFSAQLS